MVWTPKSSAPPTFRLRDAFVALITGDPNWGWLVDWAPYLPGDPWSTTDFCTAGPPGTVDLSPILGPSVPNRSPIAMAEQLAVIVASLAIDAKDRVFGAYCELVVPSGVFGAPVCMDLTGHPYHDYSAEYAKAIDVPVGASHVRVSWDAFAGPPYSGFDMWGVTAYSGAVHWDGGGTVQFHMNPGTMGGNTGTVQPVASGGFITYAAESSSSGPSTTRFCFAFDQGGTTPHAPTDQLQPPGLTLAPTTTADLPGIAAELDRQEAKLDFLLSLVQLGLRITPTFPDAGLDAPADVVPGAEIPVADALGVVVTVTGIPDELDVGFGNPQQVARLGRVNCGSAAGWYPSIPITHQPFVLRPLPPGTTRVTVSGLPPMVAATIAMILPAK